MQEDNVIRSGKDVKSYMKEIKTCQCYIFCTSDLSEVICFQTWAKTSEKYKSWENQGAIGNGDIKNLLDLNEKMIAWGKHRGGTSRGGRGRQSSGAWQSTPH